MADESIKEIEELKTEIAGLKIRIRRLEEFYNAFPNPSDYILENSNRPGERDELFEIAVRAVSQHDRASASLIQRRLQVSFSRAARILEQLEEAGVVGPAEGSKPRKVLIKDNAGEFLEKLKKEE
jgi:DNA segregation ATPase FtsK/SpoIIIE-like protein